MRLRRLTRARQLLALGALVVVFTLLVILVPGVSGLFADYVIGPLYDIATWLL